MGRKVTTRDPMYPKLAGCNELWTLVQADGGVPVVNGCLPVYTSYELAKQERQYGERVVPVSLINR